MREPSVPKRIVARGYPSTVKPKMLRLPPGFSVRPCIRATLHPDIPDVALPPRTLVADFGTSSLFGGIRRVCEAIVRRSRPDIKRREGVTTVQLFLVLYNTTFRELTVTGLPVH